MHTNATKRQLNNSAGDMRLHLICIQVIFLSECLRAKTLCPIDCALFKTSQIQIQESTPKHLHRPYFPMAQFAYNPIMFCATELK